MEITVSQEQGRVAVTVVHVRGDVDASNYTELVKKVEELYKGGAKDFLIDLNAVPFMSSAGLVALHSIAMTLRGEPPGDPRPGWELVKAMNRARDGGMRAHVKLLKLQPHVAEIFDKAGFTQFFEIFDDLQKALASF